MSSRIQSVNRGEDPEESSCMVVEGGSAPSVLTPANCKKILFAGGSDVESPSPQESDRDEDSDVDINFIKVKDEMPDESVAEGCEGTYSTPRVETTKQSSTPLYPLTLPSPPQPVPGHDNPATSISHVGTSGLDVSSYTLTQGRRGTQRRLSARGHTPAAPPAADRWTTDNSLPTVLPFTATPGLTVPCPTTPLGFIQLFITRELLEFFVVETNRNARQVLGKSRQQLSSWVDVNVTEFARYLGLTVLMGIIRVPETAMYWATDKLYHVPTFSLTMSFKRYKQIGTFFSSFNSLAVPANCLDPLLKVRTIKEYLENKFKKVYIPSRELSFDEGVMGWRGLLSFRCCQPRKDCVKFYVLAEALTGYVFNFEVHTGSESGKSVATIVVDLIEPLLHKGYHLYMDNYYNSVSLCEELLAAGVHVCGTLALTRKAPQDLQEASKWKMKPDTIIHRRKGDVTVLLWKDKRVVSMISTLHNADTQEVERRVRTMEKNGRTRITLKKVNKPVAICEYNEFMSGANHFDQMIKSYHFTRKTHKWTKKLILYFLQIALYNAFTLYRKFSSDTKKMSLCEFHEVFHDALINFDPDDWLLTGDDLPHAPDLPPESSSSEDPDDDDPRVAMTDNPGDNKDYILPDPSADPDPVGPSSHSQRPPALPDPVKRRLEGYSSSSDSEDSHPSVPPPPKKHPRIVDPPDRLDPSLDHTMQQLEGRKRKRCRVCTKKRVRRDTYYECRHCKIALCVGCAADYHRKPKYW